MPFLRNIAISDSGHLERLVAEIVDVRTHLDLFMWLHGDVQQHLPHDILLAAWGDFASGELRHDVVSGIPGVRTSKCQLPVLAPLLQALFNHWICASRQPYSLIAREV